MSLVVKLEDDLGERSDWIMLHGVIPARDEKNFPFLRCIDLYGKTVQSRWKASLKNGIGFAIAPTTNLSKTRGRKSKTWL